MGGISVAKWAAFWLLGIIWGSSFLLIRVGVEELNPFQVVFMRTGIAAVGLNLVLALRGRHLPLNWRAMLPLIVLGIGNTTMPFVLISWGETSIDSGLASVLNATAALFTLVIAHFTFADERITIKKIVGVVIGFAGVVVLASRNWVDGQLMTGGLLGQLAIVGASLCYAIFGVYSRKVIQNRFDPLTVSTGAMTFAALTSGILMLLSPMLGGQPLVAVTDMSSDVLIAMILLGLVNTFIAYLMFYWVIAGLGAARASMVTYVVPVIGLTLGAIVLNETIDARLLLGAGMIFVGILIVNLRLRALRNQRVQPANATIAAK
ncbi:hypothetical protein FBR02_16070 [Anaerolineae bacterium CFX9]|nr:hypothetical protein [Anaerolineae bacterium CFX9]